MGAAGSDGCCRARGRLTSLLCCVALLHPGDALRLMAGLVGMLSSDDDDNDDDDDTTTGKTKAKPKTKDAEMAAAAAPRALPALPLELIFDAVSRAARPFPQTGPWCQTSLRDS